MSDLHQAAAKHVADGLSFGVLISTFFSILPDVASLLTVIWMLIRVSETTRFDQFMRWLRRKD